MLKGVQHWESRLFLSVKDSGCDSFCSQCENCFPNLLLLYNIWRKRQDFTSDYKALWGKALWRKWNLFSWRL